jgi:predicted outer membrane protein
MRTVAYWKAGAAVLGLSLLVYSPALAQTASGTAQPGAATRETNQNDNAVNRSGGSASTRTGAGAQSGQSGRQGGTATNRSQGQAQQRTANRPVSDSAQSQSADHQIAGLLAIGNAEEIAMSKLAVDQAKSDEVKQFAQMMIDEHTQALKQLEKLAPEAAAQANALSQGHAGGESATAARRGGNAAGQSGRGTAREATEGAGTTRTASTGGNFDLLAVHQQIAQQCLEQAREELGEKQGAEFDMAFMGQQMVMHQQMIAKQKVFAQYASPELRQAIEQSQQGAEKHLQHAKQIVRQLAPEAAGATRERRTGSSDADSSSRENRGASPARSESRTESRQPAGNGNR